MRKLLAPIAVLVLVACGNPADDHLHPHLVGYAGTPQEVDLGPFVDWDHAYSAELDAYYRIGPHVVYFETGDCTGAGWTAPTGAPGDRYFGGAMGTLLRVEPAAFIEGGSVDANSAATGGGCTPMAQRMDRVAACTDTGVAFPVVGPIDRTIELR